MVQSSVGVRDGSRGGLEPVMATAKFQRDWANGWQEIAGNINSQIVMATNE